MGLRKDKPFLITAIWVWSKIMLWLVEAHGIGAILTISPFYRSEVSRAGAIYTLDQDADKVSTNYMCPEDGSQIGVSSETKFTTAHTLSAKDLNS